MAPDKKAIDAAMENLVAACGFDRSESGSECFHAALLRASLIVRADMRQSHLRGLSYDCTHATSYELFHGIGDEHGVVKT